MEFEVFKEKLSKGFDDTVSKVKDLGDTAKINSEISAKKRMCEKYYISLGKAFYKNNIESDNDDIKAITQLLEDIDKLEKKKNLLKGEE